MRKPFYMVACRTGEPGSHYTLATYRRFYRYSEAELFMLGIAVSRFPIIIEFE